MDSAAYRILFESIIRTLHSQSFARSSTEACAVLTDLLARYLKLLAFTCAQHAQHSGRIDLTAMDCVRGLEELGAELGDLKNFQEVEGRDLSRYAYCSQRRQMDLREIKAYLSEGLVEDTSGLQHIVYERYESSDNEVEEEEEELDNAIEEDPIVVDREAPMDSLSNPTQIQVLIPPVINVTRSPPLPPSPISNPSSPGPRKRLRLNSWEAHDHIPDFLPPFPITISEPTSTSPNKDANGNLAETPIDQVPETPIPATPHPTSGRELSPTPPPSAPTGRASYLSSVPYESSSISGKSTSHLPKPPPKTKPKTAVSPAAHLALLTAQHHFLTNPPPLPSTQLPSRHTLALSLLQGARNRYSPPDSVFGISEPNRPRFGTPTPSFPVAIRAEDQKARLPQTSKSVVPEPIVPLVSFQPSRLPFLASNVLPPAIYRKASRIHPPPPLQRDQRKLTYGPGVPAIWNTTPDEKNTKDDKQGSNQISKEKKEKEEGGVKLVDALMYATWDWDVKDFRVPLGPRKGMKPTFGKGKYDREREREQQ